ERFVVRTLRISILFDLSLWVVSTIQCVMIGPLTHLSVRLPPFFLAGSLPVDGPSPSARFNTKHDEDEKIRQR
ncbi:hypothetical protein BJV74DRAFT_859661, partial [Russula compacta]